VQFQFEQKPQTFECTTSKNPIGSEVETLSPASPWLSAEEKKDLIKKAIELWGTDAQLIAFSEEMGELLTAVSHFKRGRIGLHDLIVEMADVRIMMDELMYMFGIHPFMLDLVIESQYIKFKENYERSLDKRKKESARTEEHDV
jgi:hypothetical protein